MSRDDGEVASGAGSPEKDRLLVSLECRTARDVHFDFDYGMEVGKCGMTA